MQNLQPETWQLKTLYICFKEQNTIQASIWISSRSQAITFCINWVFSIHHGLLYGRAARVWIVRRSNNGKQKAA